MIIFLLLAIDIGIPLGLLILFLLLRKEKYIWSAPLVITIINIIYIFIDILTHFTYEPFAERFRLYFSNDTSMSLYLISIPMVLFSIFLTMLFMLARTYRERMNI